MMPNASAMRVEFSNALRAFQAGSISYDEFLAQLDRQIHSGAKCDELLEVLQRRAYVDALPADVYEALMRRLQQPAATGERAAGETDWPYHADTRPADDALEATTPMPALTEEHLAAREAAHNAAHEHVVSETVVPGSRRSWIVPAMGCLLFLVVIFGSWLLLKPHSKVTAHPASATAEFPTPAEVAISMPAPAPDSAHASAPQPRTQLRGGSIVLDCPNCPRMTVLPPGGFDRGAPQQAPGSGEPDSGKPGLAQLPSHVVTINYLLALSINDVTVGDFRRFVKATQRSIQGCDTYDGEWRHNPGANWEHPGFFQNDRYPVTCISWNDARDYARWISSTSGYQYRLPSAAEWEYAARSGAVTAPAWDRGDPGACANDDVADQSAARRYPGWDAFDCDDGYVNTAPVGSFKPDAFGLNDMLGNVLQWTQDCWADDYSGPPADGSARTTGNCDEHELRGGSWFTAPHQVSAASRQHFAAAYRTSSVGFRLARTID